MSVIYNPKRSRNIVIRGKNIRQCFGVADNIFAGHPIEIGFAREVLEEALNAGVSSWNEFCKPFEDYLKSKGLSASAIEKQMKRIQNLNNYFEQD